MTTKNGIAKFVMEPTGADVARLLLLCAPKDYLKEIELDDSTAAEFAADLDQQTALARYVFVETFAYALYYASRSTAKRLTCRSIIERLYISPEVLGSLVIHASIEESIQRNSLTSQLGGEGKKRVDPASDAKPKIKAEWLTVLRKGVIRGDRKKFISGTVSKYRGQPSAGTISNWIQAWNREFKNSK